MRLRNVKGSEEALAASGYVIRDPFEWKGRFQNLFGNGHPLFIEIGMGKGRFITTLAARNPHINYIGIERFSSVLVRALEKQRELKLPNLYFMNADAELLFGMFGKGEVDGIYLNFSDPWPKDRHAKRRLTSRNFFRLYREVLKAGGEVQFKTDNKALFEFSLAEAEAAGFAWTEKTDDLHNSPLAADNVMTEYEERFSAKGNPICMMRARWASGR